MDVERLSENAHISSDLQYLIKCNEQSLTNNYEGGNILQVTDCPDGAVVYSLDRVDYLLKRKFIERVGQILLSSGLKSIKRGISKQDRKLAIRLIKGHVAETCKEENTDRTWAIISREDANISARYINFWGDGFPPAHLAFSAWQNGKIIYKFNRDLFDEISDMDISLLPMDVLKKLPYPCPYIHLGAIKGIAPGELINGFFVYLARLNNKDLVCFITIGVGSDGASTVRYIPLDASLNNITSSILSAATPENTHAFDGAVSITKKMVNALLYICSRNADVTRSLSTGNVLPQGKQRKLRENKNVTMLDCGYRVSRFLTNNGVSGYQSASGGKVKSAHVRRSHWHTYIVGKGEAKHRVLKWVAPIFINSHLEQVATIKTIGDM